MKRILILGDSYCADTGPGTWIKNIESDIEECEVKCIGMAGCSNWFIYNNFVEHYSPYYDYIIILITGVTRIPIVTDRPDLSAFVPLHPNFHGHNLPIGYKDAIKGYLNFFYDEDFLYWVTQNIIKNIEDMIHFKQKLFWIDATGNGEFIFKNVKKGLAFKGSLRDISIDIEIRACRISWGKYMSYYNTDKRSNHISFYNQRILSNHLVNLIENYDYNNIRKDELDLSNLEWTHDKDIIWPDLKIPEEK